jgi:hypothetical protein
MALYALEFYPRSCSIPPPLPSFFQAYFAFPALRLLHE